MTVYFLVQHFRVILYTYVIISRVTRTFGFFFFPEANPHRPLINRLKWFFKKIRFRGDICEISVSAQANTAQSFAGNNFVFAGLALPWRRIPNLKKIHVNYLLQHCPTFFVSFFKELSCQNILTPRSVSLMKSNFSNLKFWKQIFKQNYFSMFIRGPDGFDSWNKKDNKISWHCPFKLNLKNIVQHFYWPRTFQLPRN